MSEHVPAEDIERIVGMERHPTEHWGRAVSAEQTVYIMHSQECRDSATDLRECPFSLALDRGIEHAFPWTGWRRVQDQPVRLEIARGYLMPEFAAYKDAMRGER
jgi:hypothetical protein